MPDVRQIFQHWSELVERVGRAGRLGPGRGIGGGQLVPGLGVGEGQLGPELGPGLGADELLMPMKKRKNTLMSQIKFKTLWRCVATH